MSTSTVAPTADEALDPGELHIAPGEHVHPKESEYVKIAVILAILTALEVAAHYVNLGAALVPSLMVMMIVKFYLVVLYFMHLKYDSKVFGRLFYAGLAVAVVVYIITLMTFQFFTA